MYTLSSFDNCNKHKIVSRKHVLIINRIYSKETIKLEYFFMTSLALSQLTVQAFSISRKNYNVNDRLKLILERTNVIQSEHKVMKSYSQHVKWKTRKISQWYDWMKISLQTIESFKCWPAQAEASHHKDNNIFVN